MLLGSGPDSAHARRVKLGRCQLEYSHATSHPPPQKKRDRISSPAMWLRFVNVRLTIVVMDRDLFRFETDRQLDLDKSRKFWLAYYARICKCFVTSSGCLSHKQKEKVFGFKTKRKEKIFSCLPTSKLNIYMSSNITNESWSEKKVLCLQLSLQLWSHQL